MNLSFSTTWNERMGELAGQPTYFVEKILNGLYECDLGLNWFELESCYSNYCKFSNTDNYVNDFNHKLHTIREDPHDHWKVGSKIHFIINPRTPNRFQFAPILGVKSVQRIDIAPNASVNSLYEGKVNHYKGAVFIDEMLLPRHEVETLAQNDGFNSVDDFFKWFDKDFSGKLIHWTNLKY